MLFSKTVYLGIFCNSGPKFTEFDMKKFGISEICKESSGEDQHLLDSSQISWDFATNIFEIFRK